MRLKDLKIGRQLGMSFAICIFFAAAIGLVGFYLAGRLINDTDFIVDMDYFSRNTQFMRVQEKAMMRPNNIKFEEDVRNVTNDVLKLRESLEKKIAPQIPDSSKRFLEETRSNLLLYERNLKIQIESYRVRDTIGKQLSEIYKNEFHDSEKLSIYDVWILQLKNAEKEYKIKQDSASFTNWVTILNKAVLAFEKGKQTGYLSDVEKYRELMNNYYSSDTLLKASHSRADYHGFFTDLPLFNVKVQQHVAMQDMVKYSRLWLIGLIVFLILISAIMAVGITKFISKKININTQVAIAISNGNLNIDFDDSSITLKNEIGHLSKALKVILTNFNKMASKLQTTSGNVALAGSKMNSSSYQLSQRATEQAASLEQITVSMEEMVSNVEQNTDNAKKAEKIAISAAQGIGNVHQTTEKPLPCSPALAASTAAFKANKFV